MMNTTVDYNYAEAAERACDVLKQLETPDAVKVLEESLPLVITVLSSEDGQTRYLAVRMLGYMGAYAKAAVPALTELLNDEDEWVRESAAEALEKIGASN